MVPHACFFIDSSLKTNLEGLEQAIFSRESNHDRNLAVEDLHRLWTQDGNVAHILPCLSVRSGLDLYFSAMSFPAGSEVIITAVNIPDIPRIIHHHNLRIRVVDIDISTTCPSSNTIESLINEKTVAVFIAHIYGRRVNLEPITAVCRKHKLPLLEDCAETFAGFQYTGCLSSLITFFSFGTIKTSTAYGGGICVIRDRDLFDRMTSIHDTYDVQPICEYTMKVLKYTSITTLFNSTFLVRYGMSAFRAVGIDHKRVFLPLLRGFPNNLMDKIRRRPSVALLRNLTLRLLDFKQEEFNVSKLKGDYMQAKLPVSYHVVGENAMVRNYWLFPVLVDNPDKFVGYLNDYGVDASTGSTQLRCVQDDTVPDSSIVSPSAKFIMDHVVYLPVHRLVSYDNLDKIANVVHNFNALISNRDTTTLETPSLTDGAT